jgi:hypothetical protein
LRESESKSPPKANRVLKAAGQGDILDVANNLEHNLVGIQYEKDAQNRQWAFNRTQDEGAQVPDREGMLNILQMYLDGVGLVPGLGEPADLANAVISLARGNYVDAGLSASSAIPIAGWFATAGKWAKRGFKAADAAENALKYGTKLLKRAKH